MPHHSVSVYLCVTYDSHSFHILARRVHWSTTLLRWQNILKNTMPSIAKMKAYGATSSTCLPVISLHLAGGRCSGESTIGHHWVFYTFLAPWTENACKRPSNHPCCKPPGAKTLP